MSVFDNLKRWDDCYVDPPTLDRLTRIDVSPDMFAYMKHLYGSNSPQGVGAAVTTYGISIVVICVFAPMTWRLVHSDGHETWLKASG